MMWMDKIERTILVIIYIIIHVAVIYNFQLNGAGQEFSPSWNDQFVGASLLMMVLAGMMPFLKSAALYKGLLGLRLLITAVLAVPTASYPGSIGLLYLLLIFDGFRYYQGITAYVFGIFCLACPAVLAYLRPSSWYRPANPIDTNSLIYSLLGSGLSYVMSLLWMRERKLRRAMQNKIRVFRLSNQYLAETNIKLQNVAVEAELTVTLRERNRIAREIHDTVAYTLTNLLSLLDVYRERLQFDLHEIPKELNQARALVRDGLGDLRAVLRGLRSKEEDGYNGLGKVKRLVTVFSQATGIKVALEYGDAPQYPGKDIEEVLYRVVQEGLTNAFRHGLATKVFVHFQCFKKGIELSICDNGKGTATFTGGFGLLGIKERVEALEGLVDVASQVDAGFTLRVWVPICQKEGAVNAVKAGNS
jgi:signal transduction histidine kinase